MQLVMLTLRFGGKFVEDPQFRYDGREEDVLVYEEFDVDYFSFFELKYFVETQGVKNVVEFWFALPGLELKDSLRRVVKGEDYWDLTKVATTYGEIEIYALHPVDEPDVIPPCLPSNIPEPQIPQPEQSSPARRVKRAATRNLTPKPHPASPSPTGKRVKTVVRTPPDGMRRRKQAEVVGYGDPQQGAVEGVEGEKQSETSLLNENEPTVSPHPQLTFEKNGFVVEDVVDLAEDMRQEGSCARRNIESEFDVQYNVDYDFEDPGADTIIPIDELVRGSGGSESDDDGDDEYTPTRDDDHDSDDVEFEHVNMGPEAEILEYRRRYKSSQGFEHHSIDADDEGSDGIYISDPEYEIGLECLADFYNQQRAKAKLRRQHERETAKGKLGQEPIGGQQSYEDGNEDNEQHSEYERSEDEMDNEVVDDDGDGPRLKRNTIVRVGEKTDFNNFKWETSSRWQ